MHSVFPSILAGLLTLGVLGPFPAALLRKGAPATHHNQRTPGETAAGLQSETITARANLQSTRSFNTRPLSSLGGYLWKTKKLYTLEPKKLDVDDDSEYVARMLSVGHQVSDPVFANGLLYFAVYVGNGYLVALDAKSGEQKWMFKRTGGVVSTPAIVGDTVYLGVDSRTIVSLNAFTGEEQWRFTAAPVGEPAKGLLIKIRGHGYAASPVASGGLVLFGTIDGDFFAVDAQKHQLTWGVHLGGMLGPITVGRELVYSHSSAGFLFALDAKTGKERWRIKGRYSLPVTADNTRTLYYNDRETLFAVDAITSQQKWKTKIHGKIGGLLALADSTLYFSGFEDSVYAYDAETGQEKWRFKTRESCDAPVIARTVVYAGSLGQLFAIDSRTGNEIWELTEKDLTFTSPAVADAVLYAATTEGYLCAIH
jgi:outer membrane protein assembly factor BamB